MWDEHSQDSFGLLYKIFQLKGKHMPMWHCKNRLLSKFRELLLCHKKISAALVNRFDYVTRQTFLNVGSKFRWDEDSCSCSREVKIQWQHFFTGPLLEQVNIMTRESARPCSISSWGAWGERGGGRGWQSVMWAANERVPGPAEVWWGPGMSRRGLRSTKGQRARYCLERGLFQVGRGSDPK